MRVLVVEDDPDLRRGVRRFLEAAGFVIDEAGDLLDADLRIGVNEYDCLVLDRRLPSGDSIDLLARYREQGLATPVLFLTALDSVANRVEGLYAGADDYLVKPFAMDELVARVHGLCRRSAAPAPTRLILDDVELDPGRHEVKRRGVLLTLTAKEFCLLRYLMSHSGQVISRTLLIEHCWDEHADPMSNVVDVRVRQLRQKLGEPDVIHTVRGAGYVAEARHPPMTDG